jgi:hypothetical protein
VIEGPDGESIRVEAIVGRGGFGQVFAGRLPDGTRVAVKTLLTAYLDDHELKAFQNEAQLAVGISHANVVRVLHVHPGDTSDGRPPYLVMEFVDGGTLRELIDAHRAGGTRPALDGLLAIYEQIASGMTEINARLVHRDLKPENVLVDATGGVLKIADFGLAKLADAATRSETFKGWGTRPYQAPEAFELGPNTVAMDVYSAGVLFYELATLNWPFKPKPGDNSPLGWRNAHLLSPPPDIRSVRTDLPIGLAQLITLMLHKDSVRRPGAWDIIVEKLRQPSNAPVGPNVSALVTKATATLVRRTEAEARAREASEKKAERDALLKQAFVEPMEVLQGLIEAFNQVSMTGRLTLTQRGDFNAEVRSDGGARKLVLDGHIISDTPTQYIGIARILAMVRLSPAPQAKDQHEAIMDRESFGSFNLVYMVRKEMDRFGEWGQIRFEVNPLISYSTYPRWFAVSLSDLPRELQVLRAVGEHQHQKGPLDDEWFKALLVQIL